MMWSSTYPMKSLTECMGRREGCTERFMLCCCGEGLALFRRAASAGQRVRCAGGGSGTLKVWARHVHA
jgi:hypothetical protein